MANETTAKNPPMGGLTYEGRLSWVRDNPDLAAAAIDDLLRKVARLEGYSEGLRNKLVAVRKAAGCGHD